MYAYMFGYFISLNKMILFGIYVDVQRYIVLMFVSFFT